MKRKELNLAIILVLFLLLSNIYSYIQYKEISEVQSFLYELKKDSDIKIGQLEALKECRANEILLNGNEIFILFIGPIFSSIISLMYIFSLPIFNFRDFLSLKDLLI